MGYNINIEELFKILELGENMEIRNDNLISKDVIELVSEHKNAMLEITPEESVHALNLSELKDDCISFWTIWNHDYLMGCGALKELSNETGEVKSMRTHSTYLRQGVAERMLKHIIEQAKFRGYKRLYLETGVADEFIPAHRLYRKFGFVDCGPFDEYVEDVHSCFMVLSL